MDRPGGTVLVVRKLVGAGPASECQSVMRQKLSHSFSGALRTFSFWVANRTVGKPLLEGIDYSCIFEEPSALEITYAIFANVIELDAEGRVVNAKHAERRAAQWIRSYVDPSYTVEPPFEDWETMLHEPPAAA